MTVHQAVEALVAYGVETTLLPKEEKSFAANYIYDTLGIEPESDFDADAIDEAEALATVRGAEEEWEGEALERILAKLLDHAVADGKIDGGIASRDLLDTKLMAQLVPRPKEVIRVFWEYYQEDKTAATDYFYKLCLDCDYIRRYRIVKDRKWIAPTPYGDLDITINLSKPEKDPKAIAAALSRKQSAYPKCLLCHANEGYAGRLDHPARQNLRQIPLTLGGEQWYLQYSPYVYYNEHCIVLSAEHRPMKIDTDTFVRLLDFVELFPHYTVGSNADLPIVGGSILTHEHFQGGRYTFAMERADFRKKFVFDGFEDIEAGIVNWPMSVIRLRGKDRERLTKLCEKILVLWRGYTDASVDILAESDGEPHNTITPIARMRDGQFEMDLVLRNNRTTEEYPLGIFHPHEELHHIKKENIGLIEVMGLAVLPARLLSEMERLKEVLLAGEEVAEIEEIASHADWAKELTQKYEGWDAKTIDRVIQDEIGIVFAKVLEHAGVYKDTEAGRAGFDRFVERVQSER